MTDTRLPERWLNDRRILKLSDRAFRSFVTSLMWSVSNRTEGVIEPDDLKLIPSFEHGVVDEFVEAGLWIGLDHRWLIDGYALTQTTKLQLEAIDKQRVRERDKKRAQRAGQPYVPGDVPRDKGSGTSRGTTQARLGQASPGLAKVTEEQNSSNPNPSKAKSLPKSGTETTRARRQRTQVSDDYMPPTKVVDAIRAELPNVTNEQLKYQHRKFIDHWKKTGKPMADWDATWRNWIRTAAERGEFESVNGHRVATSDQRVADILSMKSTNQGRLELTNGS